MGNVFDVLKVNQSRCPELASIRKEVEDYSEIVLKDYIEKCKDYQLMNSLHYLNSKIFFDSIWGTIELNEGEILLIDSPIIQRLRKIKQLGLVDLLFSSANHSRFSHMLGVLFASNLMAIQISRELEKNRVVTPKKVFQIIRLSAIFHDCGHLFCSHATERYFQKNSSSRLNKLYVASTNYFFSNLNIKPTLSEIISVLIVNSPSVRKLFSILDKGFEDLDFDNNNQDSTIESIACLILGYPYTYESVPFSRIINGEIDADKLDYLKRDAYSTGIPSAVDTSRIIQKIRVSNSSKTLNMVSKSSAKNDTCRQLSIHPSAINTIDQMMISRLCMFENVYFHPKTLGTETYFRIGLSELDSSTEGLLDNLTTTLHLNDSDFINPSINFCELDPYKFKIVNQEKFDNSKRIFNNIYKRYLLKRSVAISPKNLTYLNPEYQQFFVEIFENENLDRKVEFVNHIKEKHKEILKILFPETRFDEDNIDVVIMFSPQYSTINLNSNVIIAGKINTYRDDIFEADNWLKSRTARDKKNYIITNNEFRYSIYLATELVLFENYGIQLRDTELYDEKDEERINELRTKLVENRVYHNAHPLIQLDCLSTYTAFFEDLSNKWGRFEILNSQSMVCTRIDSQYIASYLKQFYKFEKDLGDFPIFLNESLDLLNSIHVISKNEIENSLANNLIEIIKIEDCKPDDILIYYLGNFQDSSSQIGYHINSINKKLNANWLIKRLDEFDENENKHIIVFIDDAFYTGNQIISIFQELAGIPDKDRILKERHLPKIEPHVLPIVQKSNIYLSLVYKNTEKEKDILKELEILGISLKKIIATKEFPAPYFISKDFISTKKEGSIIEKYFLRAGEELIRTKSIKENGEIKENWPESRIKNSFLGYENAQQLVIFPWNTPTYTITALWMSCNKPDFVWFPLFPRIDKKH